MNVAATTIGAEILVAEFTVHHFRITVRTVHRLEIGDSNREMIEQDTDMRNSVRSAEYHKKVGT